MFHQHIQSIKDTTEKCPQSQISKLCVHGGKKIVFHLTLIQIQIFLMIGILKVIATLWPTVILHRFSVSQPKNSLRVLVTNFVKYIVHVLEITL
jgi:hypothetical protein